MSWHDKVILIVNLASVEQIATAAATQIAPLRFRANIYVSGLAPWTELDWVGKIFKMGKANWLASSARNGARLLM